MEEITLKFPEENDKQEVMDFLQEHFLFGELELNGVGGLDKLNDFKLWVEKVKKDLNDPAEGRVKATQFIAITNSRRIVGMIQIRHELNESLLQHGGHIGYGVRPSERKKGYATKMLELALRECKNLGIKDVLVTCNKKNIGSAKTIQKNGGILENEIEENGILTQRYWISIK